MRLHSILTRRWFISRIGIPMSKYYEWRKRYSQSNNHNGNSPRYWWILDGEKEAIVDYCRQRVNEGYRRLTYIMIDEDIAAVSPSSVYRILKDKGLLQDWNKGKASSKGNGFIQPKAPHDHWHMDIAYVNVMGSFMFLISVLDGYSRMILHHELRTTMTEYDVQITLQRALEKYPGVYPRLISDNGKQFIAKNFREYLRECGLKQVRTSVYYPQSNGKKERWYRTLKSECIRPKTPISLEEAKRVVFEFVDHYNNKRLHSSLGYIAPVDKLHGREIDIFTERDRKLEQARDRRRA
ncbi:IS3 family transposase, partial [bacterium]|nr:IS3 family transposase [bacterium]